MKVEISLLFCWDICIPHMQVSCVFFACFGGGLVGFCEWDFFVCLFFVCFVVCLGYFKKPLWLVSQSQWGFERRVAIRSGRECAVKAEKSSHFLTQLQNFISVRARKLKSLRAKVSQEGQKSMTQFTQTKEYSWTTLVTLEAHGEGTFHRGWEAHSLHMLLVSLHTKGHNVFFFIQILLFSLFKEINQSVHLRNSSISW